MQGNRPAGACLLALLLVASSSAALAGGGTAGSYSGRVMTSHGAAARARDDLQYTAAVALMRQLEDEVAPELLSSLLLGASNNDRSHRAVEQADKPACNPVCSDPGDSYHGRGCKKYYRCPPS